ncbi:uncharacterized protein PFLUO_LOCUS4823 [Penicillium psychrofluorescens]|uniref:uncharacterized protein n=1 Tax=Penicillium psychrofluorescens TaxID=3158075 RepID=UPI003CCE3B3F
MLDEGQQSSETSPLLRNGSYEYNSVGHQDDVEAGSTAGTEVDEASILDLTRVSSIPQGLQVEPNLNRRIFSANGTANDAAPDDKRYSSRFIGVSPTRFWLIYSGVMLGHPVITSYFNASNTASWLSTAFLLTSTAFLPLFGRISDAFGRKPVYLFAISVFFLTTAWCGLAQSIGSFIAARALCGLGAGGVFSMGQVISSDLVRIEYRGIYQSYINLCLGIGSCLGLALGGLLCDQVGWRGAFLVQLPFIFVYFVLAAWTVPSGLGVKRVGLERVTVPQLIRSIDLTGSFILIVAVTALIMGLNLGGNVFPWSHPLVIVSLVASVILSVIFVRYERNVPRAVMPVELLSKNPRASIIFGNFFGSMSTNTMMFNAPLYFQAVKLASPTDSGLRLVAATAAVTISSVGTGFLITWTKRLKPPIIAGGLCMLVGGCAAASMGMNTPDGVAMICVSLTLLGQGFTFPSLMVSVLATSEQSEAAVATTTLGLWRNLGSVMGVAASSWVFQNTLVFQLEHMVTGPDKRDIISLVRKSVRVIADLDSKHRHQVMGAYAAALRLTFLSAAVWAATMLLLHLRLRLPRLGSKH